MVGVIQTQLTDLKPPLPRKTWMSQSVKLIEQWVRGTERKEDTLSCQLTDLGSVSSAVVDELSECILLEGAQEAEIRNTAINLQEDSRQYSNPCFLRSATLCRCVADTSKVNTQVHTEFTEETPRQESFHIIEDVPRQILQTETKVVPHSTPLTLNWLSENYELAEGVCIPRNVIYKHYCDFCQKNGMIPVNPASFGKIIRQKFKMVKNRRLGTRGYSTYHYYGIGIRNFSVYYEEQYSRNGLANSLQGKRGAAHQVYSGPSTNLVTSRGNLSSTTVPVLEFPNLQDVPLPASVPDQLYRSFFTMYRAHCLRIFNSICRNELDEVQEFLSHFWKGVPLHLMGILGSNAVVNMVGVCDSILYRSIASIFVPSTRKTSPLLLAMLKKLVPLIDVWFYSILTSLPANLCSIKRNLAHHFCRILRRLISLNQIWLSVALLLQNTDSITKMLADWRGANVEQICSEVAFGVKWPETKHIMFSLFKEFEYLLESQVGLDILIQWFETVVERCVTSIARERGCSVKRVARNFLLIWVTVGTRVLRDLTLTSTNSFGSFHMLSLLANDYLAHSIELLEAEERTAEMMRNISAEGEVSANPTTTSRQNVPSATVTSQEILGEHSFKYEYTDETPLSTSMPITYQASLNGVSKSSYDNIYLSSQRQTSFGAKDELLGNLTQDIRIEDCQYNSNRHCEYIDMPQAAVICTTSSCAYQGYQQYTMTDCHSNRSAS